MHKSSVQEVKLWAIVMAAPTITSHLAVDAVYDIEDE